MKLKSYLLAVCVAVATSSLLSQPGMGGRPNMGGMKMGHFYGKVVDGEGKGLGYATVTLTGMVMDTVSKTMKESLIDGQITDDNGDFSLEKLPVFGNFTLKISYLGFNEISQVVTFGLTPEKMAEMRKAGGSAPGGAGGGGFKMPEGMNFDIDLGNISMVENGAVLDEVVVSGQKTNMVIALDKKIFRVDQDVTARGGTAEDALRNVPSLSVDLDGNVSLRNGSPQIFIDGRPTTLTLNQIPADDIESVELITNPSAKYDASGGQSGIVNIVLKKNQKIGYNGMLMAGLDSQLGTNLGGNINLKEGKINIFLNGFANARRGDNFNNTDRLNLYGSPQTRVIQSGVGESQGSFANIRGGFDYFIDNRNTITFQGSFMRGLFGGPQDLTVRTDSLFSTGTTFSQYNRTTDSDRVFKNVGGSVLFKHLFVKKGRELTADLNINSISFENDGLFVTNYTTSDRTSSQRQSGLGGTNMFTFQSDYVDPLTPTIKLESGVSVSVRQVDNNNYNYLLNNTTSSWDQIKTFADEYGFSDNVAAAYSTVSQTLGQWSYQLGLRAESSFYQGELGNGETFSNQYPISLFPSLFITKQLNEEDNIQFSVSRRIKRPNFFQLIPFTDFSDTLNLRRGNPNLIPEFTNSVELSYQNIINQNHNILATLYYKQAKNLITSYQIVDIDPITGRNLIISTFANSNLSYAYGLELTVRNEIGKKVSLSSNMNFYNSRVDASNVESSLVNDQFTWFIKENFSFVLPKNFRLQLSGQYQSRTAYTLSSGERWGHGGGGNSAQGYATPVWYVDAGLSKSFLKNKLTASLNISDIFGSRINGSYSESPLFIQTSERYRNFRVVRLNMSYRFGKMDTSLFRRKNMNSNDAGSDMMGG